MIKQIVVINSDNSKLDYFTFGNMYFSFIMELADREKMMLEWNAETRLCDCFSSTGRAVNKDFAEWLQEGRKQSLWKLNQENYLNLKSILNDLNYYYYESKKDKGIIFIEPLSDIKQETLRRKQHGSI